MRREYFNILALSVFITAVVIVTPGNAQMCRASFAPVLREAGWDVNLNDAKTNCSGHGFMNATCQFMFYVNKTGMMFKMSDPGMITCKEYTMANCPQTCSMGMNSTDWTSNMCTFCCQPGAMGSNLTTCARNLPNYKFLLPILNPSSGSYLMASTSLIASFALFLLAKHLS